MSGYFVRFDKRLLGTVFLFVAGAIAASLVFGMLSLQVMSVYRLFPSGLQDNVEAIAEMAFLLDNVPEEARPMVVSTFSSSSRAAAIRPEFPADAVSDPALQRFFMDESGEYELVLANREMRFRRLNARKIRRAGDGWPDVVGLAAMEVAVTLESGEVVVIWMTPLAFLGHRALPAFAFLILLGLGIGVAGALMVRHLVKPLRELEASAARFDLSSAPAPVEESGPQDIRRLTKALNEMQARVQKLIQERSQLVAGVAHDIRTNLTRIRLRIDRVKPETRHALEGDLSYIDRLVNDMMVFARAEQPTTEPELVELRAFLADFTGSLPFDVEFECQGEPFWLAVDPAALQRALANLVENARLYAGGIRISCARTPSDFQIRIDDDGPGIPEDRLARVFEPFFRLEPSRNQETGGSGLGLTISRGLLAANGASLELANRPEGGLRATIGFPADAEVS